jgi:c-di-GMP-binding flagellar brake protein YcgR
MGLENRQFRRVVVGPEFTVSFIYGGEPFSGINLGNISEGGCFAIVPSSRAEVFEPGGELEELTLHHELMPNHALEARVTFALGAGDPEMDWVGVGVRFVSVPMIVRKSLQDFVAAIPEQL